MSAERQSIGEVLFALGTLGIRQRPRDLSLTALSSLSTIERTGPRRLTDLAVGEGVTQPSMSAIVSQLERLGLAERRSDARDGRVVRVAITAAGLEHLSTLRRVGASVYDVLIDKLDSSEVASLHAAFSTFGRMLELADDDSESEGCDMTAVPTAEGRAADNAAAHDPGRPVLVVGVDGSAPSWDAFAWAVGEARRGNGRMVAVFATSLIEPQEALGSTAPLGYAAAADARDQMAEELAAEVARRAAVLGVEVRFIRRIGDAAHVLSEVAQSEHADLMVVGRSAKMLHRLAGSVSRRLVLNRESPVIVVVP